MTVDEYLDKLMAGWPPLSDAQVQLLQTMLSEPLPSDAASLRRSA